MFLLFVVVFLMLCEDCLSLEKIPVKSISKTIWVEKQFYDIYYIYLAMCTEITGRNMHMHAM